MRNDDTLPKYKTSHQTSLAWRMIEDNNIKSLKAIECKIIFFQQVDDRREEIPYSPGKKRGKLRVSGDLKRLIIGLLILFIFV